MKSTTIKNAHFWIIFIGSVIFCLWLAFGVEGDLRGLQSPMGSNLEQGFHAMALNYQTANTLAIQDVRLAVSGLAGYIAFVVVVISHKYLWRKSAE